MLDPEALASARARQDCDDALAREILQDAERVVKEFMELHATGLPQKDAIQIAAERMLRVRNRMRTRTGLLTAARRKVIDAIDSELPHHRRRDEDYFDPPERYDDYSGEQIAGPEDTQRPRKGIGGVWITPFFDLPATARCFPAPHPSPEIRVLVGEINDYLARTDPRWWGIVKLDVMGYKQEEIAAALGVSQGTISRELQAIHQELKGRFDASA